MEPPNMNISSRIADLISGYLFNELNDYEMEELEQWINASTQNKDIFESILDESNLEDQGRIYTSINVASALIKVKQQLEFAEQTEVPKDRKMKQLWVRITVAASLLLIGTIGVYYLNHSRIPGPSTNLVKQAVINPGSNKATLTLANGKKIMLSSATKGELANEAGVVITKTADGILVYEVKDRKERGNHEMNMLSTPNGGQYQVSLPDGTKVWLNAATSLKYPASFSRTKERKVELTGEAYFEVAKDKTHPFVVVANQQTVEVLGTHFNINSYTNQEFSKTTLLEGSVKINGRILLKPGEEGALTKSGALAVHAVDAESAIAWKNGLFIFENETLKIAMDKIARWYDVEVEYQNPSLKSLTVGGIISRFEKVSEVLNLFEKAADIQFTLKGRTIIICNKKK